MILLVSAQDVYRMVGIPVQHPQSTRLARYNPIVEKLRAAHIESKVFAANRWHDGLYVSYAAENVRNYLGAPLLNLPAGLMGQLQQSSAAVYLRWHVLNAPRQAAALDAFVPAAPWKLLSTVPDLDSAAVVEIYALPW